MPGINLEVSGGLAFTFFLAVLATTFVTLQYEPAMRPFIWASLYLFTATGPIQWLASWIRQFVSDDDSGIDGVDWCLMIGYFGLQIPKYGCVAVGTYYAWHGAESALRLL
jgi:hypothetical protein